MSKIYSVIYSDNGGPRAKPSIVIPAGDLRCERIKVYTEGRITQLVVKQVDGTPVDFKVELLKSRLPYPPNAEQSIPYTPTYGPEIYRILPQQSGTLGILEVTHEQTGWAYLNVDAGYTDSEPFVYLVIIPTSAAGETTWDVCITAVRDIG